MSHVRLSREMQYGPLIPKGDADIIVGFEPIETLRVFRAYGHNGTKIIMNPRPNYPLGTLIGETPYPEVESIIGELKRLAAAVEVIEATEMAKKEGSAVSTNVLMVGYLAGSGAIPVPISSFEKVLSELFQNEALELNRRIFQLGFEAAAR